VRDELGAEERDNRHGDNVRAEESDDDSERERGEEILAHASEEDHREEDDGSGERCGEDRELNFLAAFLRGLDVVFAHFEVPEDVFEHDDGVIDKAREYERHAAENHRVDGVAERLEYEKGGYA
jgi:hypothetical protein